MATVKSILLKLGTFTLALCAASSAYADFPYPKIIMQCDVAHDRMLLRFGTLDAKDIPPNTVVTLDQFKYGVRQAPADLADTWSAIPFQIGGRCRLRDGRTVNVSLESGPTSLSSPVADEYLSMSIGRQVVYRDRLAYRGDDRQTYPLSAVQLSGRKLLECAPSSPDPASSASVCHDETPRLHPGAKLPEAEAWALRRDRRRKQMEAALRPFCRVLERLPHGQIADHRFPDELYLGATLMSRAVPSGGTNVPAHTYRLNLGAGPDSTSIVELVGWTRFFDGTVLIVFQHGGADVQSFLDRAGSIDLFGTDAATVLRRDFDRYHSAGSPGPQQRLPALLQLQSAPVSRGLLRLLVHSRSPQRSLRRPKPPHAGRQNANRLPISIASVGRNSEAHSANFAQRRSPASANSAPPPAAHPDGYISAAMHRRNYESRQVAASNTYPCLSGLKCV